MGTIDFKTIQSIVACIGTYKYSPAEVFFAEKWIIDRYDYWKPKISEIRQEMGERSDVFLTDYLLKHRAMIYEIINSKIRQVDTLDDDIVIGLYMLYECSSAEINTSLVKTLVEDKIFHLNNDLSLAKNDESIMEITKSIRKYEEKLTKITEQYNTTEMAILILICLQYPE